MLNHPAAAARRLAAHRQIRVRHPGLSIVEREELVEDLLQEWAYEDARERAECGPDDSPCIENCDDAGTGEGRFHGRF